MFKESKGIQENVKRLLELADDVHEDRADPELRELATRRLGRRRVLRRGEDGENSGPQLAALGRSSKLRWALR
jgi:hypothetical protein